MNPKRLSGIWDGKAVAGDVEGYLQISICPGTKEFREQHGENKQNTPNGNRTRAACLEGKHDNHFTIGVLG